MKKIVKKQPENVDAFLNIFQRCQASVQGTVGLYWKQHICQQQHYMICVKNPRKKAHGFMASNQAQNPNWKLRETIGLGSWEFCCSTTSLGITRVLSQ